MNIIVTGGLGFVGCHLVENLSTKNNQITILSKTKTKISNIKSLNKNLKINFLDITKKKLLEKNIETINPDLIIHLAGQTSHSKSFENPLYDIDINSKSTLRILETVRKMNKNCKFILGSTFVVIGKPNKLPVNENSSANPSTIYGANRLLSEHYCKIYHDLYGIDTKIFRITNSYGPKEQVIPTKNAINYLIHRAFQGKDITIYDNGKFFRDLIYVSDVISGIKSIMSKGKSGNIYWISSGKKTWFYELGNLLESYTNAKVKYIKSPKYTSKVDVGNFIVNNSKLKKLDWKPKISLSKGIELTLKYFQNLKN